MTIRLSIISVLVLVLGACNLQPNQPQPETLEAAASYWQQVGGRVGMGHSVSYASNGTATAVAYIETNGGNIGIRVKKWNGTTWTNVGGLLQANHPTLALDSSGNPVVAWLGSCNGGRDYGIFVRRWNGSSWVNVGSGLPYCSDIHVVNVSLALDRSGNPALAFNTDGIRAGSLDVYVIRFDGAAWVSFGQANSPTDDYSTVPSLALTSSGNPVVAFQQYNDGQGWNIRVKRWNGSSWVSYYSSVGGFGGGPLDKNEVYNAYEPSLALDKNNWPVVTWYEELGGNSLNVYVKRWNGVTWTQVGTGPLDVTPFNTAYAPSVGVDTDNNPTVAWTEYNNAFESMDIFVKHWTGSAWSFVGANPLDVSLTHANYSSLSLVNGKLSVAWQASSSLWGSNSDSIYVKQYVTTP